MSSVAIHLIRESTLNTSPPDDVIVINRVSSNILVTYKDRQGGSTSKQNLLLNKNDLGRYIRNIGHLFLTDVEPFSRAQFNFPGFPCFMVNQKSLKNTDTQDALMEIADLVSASWFVDDEDCSDMPPLVSLNHAEYYDPLPRYTNDY